jgi:hypothetical protein
MWKAGTYKVVAPACVGERPMGWPSWASIERTGRLLVYGSSKPSSLPSTEGGFTPTASMVASGRETRYRTADRSVVVLWIMSGALFLGSSGSVHRCWWLHERLLYVDHMRYIWLRATREPSMESVWHVGRAFPCRVYIDSNHRDSRIWVPLVHGSLHVVN